MTFTHKSFNKYHTAKNIYRIFFTGLSKNKNYFVKNVKYIKNGDLLLLEKIRSGVKHP